MGAAAISIIAVTILATSFVSGIFGMAGGLILLGGLPLWLGVAPALVLFGTIRTAANGGGPALWRDHVHWSIIWRYLLGASVAFALMRAISFVPGKAFLYLG